jgi:hypothetical protein
MTTPPSPSHRIGCTIMGVLAGLMLFVAGSPPFVYAWMTTPADRVYTGLMFDVPDHAQYWSWVTASRGALFISNTMTPEPNSPIFLNPMMWSLARVQAVTGLGFAGLFQVWRLLACVVLGVSLVQSFRVLITDRATRRIAYLLAVGGAGFGWLLVVTKIVRHLPDVPYPLDLYVVEPNTFFASYAYPYLALAQGLVLATIVGAYRAHLTGTWRGYVMAIGGAAALACTHAYDLISVYAVLGSYGLWVTIAERRLPRRLAAVVMLVGLVSGPIALYYQRLTAADPLWRAVLAQYANAGVWTPPPVHLLVLMGVSLVLALMALPRAARAGGAGPLLAVWAVLGGLLAYLPVVFQIKLLTAWQFPLAVLAAIACRDVLWPARARLGGFGAALLGRPAIAVGLVAGLALPTNLYLYAWRFTELRRHDLPYFLSRDDRDALEWLAANTTKDDVVLAPLDIGQFVPNYGGSRTVLAHWAMTNRFFARRDDVARFFAPSTPDEARRAILARDAVTFVLRPASLPPVVFDPGGAPGFTRVFAAGSSAVYRVERPVLAAAGGSSAP